ncbi:MAG: peptide MFS transporter [Phycisphaerales bacterium]|nr:peptide MFS transporter [Planctomycetota bacterium]
MQQSPAVRAPGTLLGHPIGLFLLFMVEMWERFSYYGMRGLLVLYLVRSVTGDENHFNPGRGWTKQEASTLYGFYTGMAYLLPIVGGILADKLIGTHRSMVVGALVIMLGHIVLAISGFGDMAHNQLGMSVFIFGLALIVIGTGHFKPSVSVMVGQLYKKDDPRRDGAFTIFYMGINLGAFLCAFVCGSLGELVGWHWGFGSAAVGMGIGLLMYLSLRPKYLKGIGDVGSGEAAQNCQFCEYPIDGLPGTACPECGKENHVVNGAVKLTPPDPAATTRKAILIMIVGVILAALFGAAYHAGIVTQFGKILTPTAIAAVGLVLLGLAAWFVAIQKPGDRGPTASIFIFMFFNVFFWIAFEQAGSSVNLFTEEKTNRFLFGWEVPATWFQSVNAGLIFILAPMFSALWLALGRRNLNPSQPMKIALGLFFVGFGYIFMVWAGRIVSVPAAKASMALVLLMYFWHTVGELCLSPTGLSYVTKAAPVRFVSLLMGIWFVSSFIANLGGGLIAAQVEKIEKGEIRMPWNLGGQADFFMLFVVVSIGAAVVIAALTPLFKKLMRNPND